MVRWFRRCAALRSDVSEARFLPGPRRADVLETGDFGGDKLGGLTRYVEEPREHLGGLPRQTLADSGLCHRSRGAGLAFPSLLRTFRPQRESGDEAVTSRRDRFWAKKAPFWTGSESPW